MARPLTPARQVSGGSVTFDITELVRLADDLRGAGARLSQRTPAIMKRGAQNIKADARARITRQIRRKYLPAYPASITYDVITTGGAGTIIEIGPDIAKKQGRFGPGVEFGSANHAPLPHLIPAFEYEVPQTQVQLQLAALKAVFPT